MNRRQFLKNSAGSVALLGFSPVLIGCRDTYYTSADFVEAPKADVHFHYGTTNDALLNYAHSIRMHLVSVNVDGGEDVDEQLDIVLKLKKQHPDKMNFLSTFSSLYFETADFADRTIARIDRCMNLGAKGIKIWKNIGMELQDRNGKYIMADHPAFAPIFAYLEKQGIPLMAHLGEPKDCWLPLEEMVMGKGYYRQNPQYHMYLHPQMPSHEAHIAAIDHLLVKYPKLKMTGAHIGSLEWNLDEVAKRFDAHPNFTVDLAARMPNLYYHAVESRSKLQSFMIQYQSRIMYGSDMACQKTEQNRIEERNKSTHQTWLQQWQFMATDEMVTSFFSRQTMPKEVAGIRLPRKVVDNIFYNNTIRVFGKPT